MTLATGGIFLKNDKKLSFFNKNEKNEHYMATLSLKGDQYNIKYDEELEIEKNSKSLDDKIWIVVKTTNFKENEGYRLRDGDIIKLGKVIFKVKEIKVDQKNKNCKKEKTNIEILNKDNLLKDRTIVENKYNNPFSQRQHIEFNQNENKNLPLEIPKGKRKKIILPQCRICLMEDNEITNPLINPCSCMGSVKYIHVDCIRKWLNSKITTKMFNFLIVHSFKNLECELCKKTFPERIKYKDEIINIYEMQKPEHNYIMLESISREKRENRYLYIIHLKEKQSIKLGRANDSDVRMTDISVSRNHASLKLFNGYLYLQDNSSKFGTLVNMQKDINVIPQRQMAIQSGKLYLLINLKKTCFAAIKCFKNNFISSEKDYNDYLEIQAMNNGNKIDMLDYVNLSWNNLTEYELESINSIKNSKKNEDGENEDYFEIIKSKQNSIKSKEEPPAIDMREISREILFTSVNLRQSDLNRNQANITDISIQRNINSENNLNLNHENEVQLNINNNQNILSTAYINLNTTLLNKNPPITTSVEFNNSVNRGNVYTNSNNILRDSNLNLIENEEKYLLRGKTEEYPNIRKVIHMKTYKKSDLRICNDNNDILSNKIHILNTNKCKKNLTKPDAYNYLGTSDSILSPGQIIIPRTTKNKQVSEFECDGIIKGKKKIGKINKNFPDTIKENERSSLNSQNVSKISRDALLNNSNFGFDEGYKKNFIFESYDFDKNPDLIDLNYLKSNNSIKKEFIKNENVEKNNYLSFGNCLKKIDYIPDINSLNSKKGNENISENKRYQEILYLNHNTEIEKNKKKLEFLFDDYENDNYDYKNNDNIYKKNIVEKNKLIENIQDFDVKPFKSKTLENQENYTCNKNGSIKNILDNIFGDQLVAKSEEQILTENKNNRKPNKIEDKELDFYFEKDQDIKQEIFLNNNFDQNYNINNKEDLNYSNTITNKKNTLTEEKIKNKFITPNLFDYKFLKNNEDLSNNFTKSRTEEKTDFTYFDNSEKIISNMKKTEYFPRNNLTKKFEDIQVKEKNIQKEFLYEYEKENIDLFLYEKENILTNNKNQNQVINYEPNFIYDLNNNNQNKNFDTNSTKIDKIKIDDFKTSTKKINNQENLIKIPSFEENNFIFEEKKESVKSAEKNLIESYGDFDNKIIHNQNISKKKENEFNNLIYDKLDSEENKNFNERFSIQTDFIKADEKQETINYCSTVSNLKEDLNFFNEKLLNKELVILEDHQIEKKQYDSNYLIKIEKENKINNESELIIFSEKLEKVQNNLENEIKLENYNFSKICLNEKIKSNIPFKKDSNNSIHYLENKNSPHKENIGNLIDLNSNEKIIDLSVNEFSKNDNGNFMTLPINLLEESNFSVNEPTSKEYERNQEIFIVEENNFIKENENENNIEEKNKNENILISKNDKDVYLL